MFIFTMASNSPEHTGELASKTALTMTKGDVLLLNGPLGAGKSVFAREFIRSLLPHHLQEQDIPSPTYTLVQTYQGKEFEIWHADLYRLQSAHEIFELGLEEAFEEALCLIEWGNRLEHYTPDDALTVAFEHDPIHSDRRTITFTTSNQGIYKQLENALD